VSKLALVLRGLLVKHRELVVVTLAALAVRLAWNLWIHRPLDYVFSDMGGYLERAQTRLDHPDEHIPYFTLFPWGTHVLLSLVKLVFGRDNGTAIGVTYAALGAGAVGYSFATAKRLTRARWAPRVVGAILVVYYPWIALGGYTLSEPPFTLLLAATAFYALRLADRGRGRDAWLLGVALALGAVFRPQILVALPLFALHLLFRRRSWHRWSARRVLPALAVPLAIILALSAWRVEWHRGELGGISSNGPLNFAFGRCHATTITSTGPNRKGIYSPPSLGALARRDKEHPDAFLRLDPAMGTTLHFEGYMWDAAPLYAMASECVHHTGLLRQAKYALTHVVLLFAYNVMWPDQNARPPFRPSMETSLALDQVLVLPAALVAMIFAFRRRHARQMLLALHVWGLFLVAVVYFGDTRLRAPYDGMLVILAVVTWAAGLRRIREQLASRRERQAAG
jgi:4-amino-4-deoxy-L-arabinose transferase-like glycosyltransferase